MEMKSPPEKRPPPTQSSPPVPPTSSSSPSRHHHPRRSRRVVGLINDVQPQPPNNTSTSTVATTHALEDDSLTWKEWITVSMREWRHNSCLMTPLSALVLFAMGSLAFLALICQIPQVVLGFLLSPLLKRGSWLVEFLYPTRLVGWGHIAICRWMQAKNRPRSAARGGGNNGGSNNNNGGSGPGKFLLGHSRTLEQRIEVVKNRVYIHAIPVLMDNLCYLIVHKPPPVTMSTGATLLPDLAALLVDCGDADDIADAILHIRRSHYSNREMDVVALLSTHKHHDHTAGNKSLKETYFPNLQHVYGGAVERVPGCSYPLRNGDIVDLPRGMAELGLELEAIAAPSHTRGSLVYNLKSFGMPRGGGGGGGGVDHNQRKIKVPGGTLLPPAGSKGSGMTSLFSKDSSISDYTSSGVGASYLFTGDAMFCGGGGVPFEADTEVSVRSDATDSKTIRPSGGQNSVERVFAELLARTSDGSSTSPSPDRVLLFPGHEYTADLMLRQFDPRSEVGKLWHQLPPSSFMETASYFFVANHRRTLPRGTKMLTVPTPLRREVKINPHFRSLKRRGEHLLLGLDQWTTNIGAPVLINETGASMMKLDGLQVVIKDSAAEQQKRSSGKMNPRSSGLLSVCGASTRKGGSKRVWNLTAEDFNRDVFTTVYAADLDKIIHELQSGRVDSATAAVRLSQLKSKLDEPVVVRRPVPGTLPSNRSIQLGTLALAILGSPPTAMTPSDGRRMNLPQPNATYDRIRVSRSRLINVLRSLGFLGDDLKGRQDQRNIELLWRHATLGVDEELALSSDSSSSHQAPSTVRTNYSAVEQSSLFAAEQASAAAADVKCGDGDAEGPQDEVELGWLKLAMYGPSAPTFWSKLCSPCGGGHQGGGRQSSSRVAVIPGAGGSGGRSGKELKQSSSELVRHEFCSCPVCKHVLGCPPADDEDEANRSILSSHSHSAADEAASSKLLDMTDTSRLSSDDDSKAPIAAAIPVTDSTDSVEMEVMLCNRVAPMANAVRPD